ncbi:MAG: carbamoyl-phosphate synthase large subunit [Actinobacteria bacterium]|nr:carbamoyl-phosphate synthase large subunit [Actinomycetota bacterium]MCG2817563.1 carbamoyl-phosphate synthase large subunit [Actinomycetes bacterium]MBU4218819.1 carbamoyl-phosphate synthase large subunit [Actinomycetota bacterium]MBU4360159.1 carbamoyl-phosphate synthase large subunit [Actinomycetota bacterium]MBU4391086.1 carbamoyl-phosphate synthase large subunit [Actinomycetota bacterium]
MPRRDDIEKILIVGSGPIIIGQACEFDYSGTQACKVLRDDGYEVVLVNSNPATIMTDPEFADRTYIEPITPEWVAKIIERERPQALLPTLGGQTGLNVSVELASSGVLERFGVEMIGASYDVINKAEDRNLFKEAMRNIGLDLPESDFAYTLPEAKEVARRLGFPLVIRPSFTLGGGGGGLVYDMEEFLEIARYGLDLSPITEILIEKSVKGWKEYELEVMRDKNDNVVIVCSIENFDPMGVHTGDSITVAPAQTLTDMEYQVLRDASIAIMREIGVETGGSNIQFAIEPDTGHMVVIEMNPRVSRSSALASKATGFPIAKIAAKLAVGYTLDEIPNDITRETYACFEPAIDYCVVKIPRWAFEKFPGADQTLTTSMKSVGEVMSIGRTFKESIQKAVRSLEIDRYSLRDSEETPVDDLPGQLEKPSHRRLFQIFRALQVGMDTGEIFERTGVDPWFLDNLLQVAEMEEELARHRLGGVPDDLLLEAKRYGFSDVELARLLGGTEAEVREHRLGRGIVAVFKSVDTCAAEFEAYTPYYYSTYESEDEVRPTDKEKVMILGSGPNRIGQGIEFDYCCVHASFACQELGYETIMVNCNPETVSTDYDTSDRLYFEPLTFEDVMNIVDRERPIGVIVQLGGQTPLKLAIPLERAGVNILGTSPSAIDRAEDRERFGRVLKGLGINHPPDGTATSAAEALEAARRIGYPVLVRPSYVLGGRAMEIVYNDEMMGRYIETAVKASPEHPVLIDKFLEDAKEIDVDALSDGKEIYIAAIMEHVEEAGIHSGDSACVIPPPFIGEEVKETIREHTRRLAVELGVVGLINVQYAVKGDEVFVLEVNPRASRTVPFVSKTIGIPIAKMATRLMLGQTLGELRLGEERFSGLKHVSIKEAVLPFVRFPGVDTVLGPEMKSTGEVMGIDDYSPGSNSGIGMAMVKAQIASYNHFPISGTVFVSVPDRKKPAGVYLAKRLEQQGFRILATEGTARKLAEKGVNVETVRKVGEGSPDVVDLIRDGEIDLVINVPGGQGSRGAGYRIRTEATVNGVPCITTIELAEIVIMGIEALKERGLSVKSIQEYHREIEEPAGG